MGEVGPVLSPRVSAILVEGWVVHKSTVNSSWVQ